MKSDINQHSILNFKSFYIDKVFCAARQQQMQQVTANKLRLSQNTETKSVWMIRRVAANNRMRIRIARKDFGKCSVLSR